MSRRKSYENESTGETQVRASHNMSAKSVRTYMPMLKTIPNNLSTSFQTINFNCTLEVRIQRKIRSNKNRNAFVRVYVLRSVRAPEETHGSRELEHHLHSAARHCSRLVMVQVSE